MKKLYSLVCLSFVLLIGSDFYCQQTANIGTGTSNTSRRIMESYYEDGRTQMAYGPGELSSAGVPAGATITSVAWNAAYIASGYQYQNANVRISNQSSKPTSYVSNPTTCWSGTFTSQGTSGWQTITLSTPFVYDGTSWLVVEFCFDNSSYGSTSYFYYTYASGNTYYNYTDGASGCSISAYGTSYRPNIQLGYTLPVSAPVAEFAANSTSGAPGASITFTDQSTNTPTAWAWDFGDGGTSTSQNPSHTYSSAGTYNVSLTASNAGGSDNETKSSYITITQPAFVWTGGGDHTDWTDGNNWAAGTTPTSSDDCSIPASPSGPFPDLATGGNCNDLVIDGQATFNVNPGADLIISGSLTCAANLTTDGKLDVTGDVTLSREVTVMPNGEIESDGNITLGNGYNSNIDGIIDCGGDFSGSGTNLNQSSSSNIYIGGNATTLGTLISSGTIHYDGSTQDVARSDYNNLVISGTGTKTRAGSSSSMSVNGTFTINSTATYDNADKTLTITGATDINGTITSSTGTIDANSTFDATGGSVTFTGAGRLQLGNTVTSLGTFTAGTGTVEFDYGSSIICPNGTFYNLEVDGSNSAGLTVFSNPTITNSIIVKSGSKLNLISPAQSLVSLDIDGILSTAVDITASGLSDIDGTLALSGSTFNADGEFDATNGTIEFVTGTPVLALSSTVTSIGSLTNTVGGTVKYDGTSAQTVGSPSSGSYNNLSIENASLKTAGGNIDVDGDLTTENESGCNFDMSSYNLNLAGNLTVGIDGGLITDDASCTVTFDGTTAMNHAGSSYGNASTSNGFESWTSDWSAAILAAPGATPALTYNVQSGTYPTCTPSEGSNMIKFNSFSCPTGSQILAYLNNPFNLALSSTVTVNFDIMSGNSYNTNDGVYVAYSLNGANWTYYNTLHKVYNSSLSDGTPQSYSLDLTSAALTSATYIGFIFESDYGDNVYMDNMSVVQTGSTVNGPTFSNVIINGSDLTLANSVDITGTLTLTSGDIISESDVNGNNSQTYASTNTITLKDGATVSGGSASSHIVGAVRAESSSTTEIEFPTGDGTNYRPAYLTPSTSTSTTYTVEYVSSAHSSVAYDGNGYNNTPVGAGIDHVSSGCWWDIEKSSGGSDAFIAITWDANSGVNIPADILLTHWNASTSMWEDVPVNTATLSDGSGAATAASGRIKSTAAQSDFSPWSPGSSTLNGGPLPVDLISFHTNCSHDIVDVNFSILSQVNNDKFLIERSTDAIDWEVVGEIPGVDGGFSNTQIDYVFTDNNPLANLSYYRLTQIDFDGKVESFYPVSNTCGGSTGGLPIDVYPNPAWNEVTIEMELDNYQGDDVYYTITDATGKAAMSDYIQLNRGFNKHTLDINKLPRGVYVLRFNQTKDHIIETRIVKR